MLQQLPQRAALQQLGDQIRCALKDAELVNDKDVGMVESRSRFCFLLKAMQPVEIATSRFKTESRARDLAHSPAPNQAENFIAIKFRPCGHSHQ